MKICTICHKRPTQVPNRNIPGRPIKRICQKCHEEQLRKDLQNVLARNKTKSTG